MILYIIAQVMYWRGKELEGDELLLKLNFMWAAKNTREDHSLRGRTSQTRVVQGNLKVFSKITEWLEK